MYAEERSPGFVYCCRELEGDGWCKSFEERDYDYCCDLECPELYPFEKSDGVCFTSITPYCRDSYWEEIPHGSCVDTTICPITMKPPEK